MSGFPLGVFARCFPVQPAPQLATTIAGYGFALVQLNLSAVGETTIPDEAALAEVDFEAIRSGFDDAGLGIWGLSGSYNMADPDAERARATTVDAARLVRRAPALGATAVTLCSGTRDAENMWRAHPDNDTPDAWADLLANLVPLLDAADEADVLLAVEPEPSNVISGTDAAMRLMDELGDRRTRIGFVLDPANLVGDSPSTAHEAILWHAFDQLGPAAICVHAKDIVSWDERLSGVQGLDFDLVRRLHSTLPHPVPIVIQDADAANILAVKALVEGDR